MFLNIGDLKKQYQNGECNQQNKRLVGESHIVTRNDIKCGRRVSESHIVCDNIGNKEVGLVLVNIVKLAEILHVICSFFGAFIYSSIISCMLNWP
jgi:hypothetical protein